MMSGGDGTLVRVGGPGTIGLPSRPTPFPASGPSGAVACWGPKTETGNEYDVESFATQPSIGTVRADFTPCCRFSSRNCWYPLDFGSPVFRKNQSFVRFDVFSRQLYRDVELPPQRRAVGPSAQGELALTP